MLACRKPLGLALSCLALAACSDAGDEPGVLPLPSTAPAPASASAVDPGSDSAYRNGRIWLTRDLETLDVPEVRLVQRWLNARGYHVVVDGIYGPQTAGAVARFQSDHWLDVDGNVGPKTYSMLQSK